MIDKLTPRFLDKSSDRKLVRKTSLIDALNIYVDVEDSADDSAGVIKPIKGNTAIVGSFSDNTEYKAIGSVTDDNTGVVYFFVWSNTPSEHSIWAYDHRGVLPNVLAETVEGLNFGVPTAGKLYNVIKSNQFKFPVNGFVKGDVVYTNTREFDKYEDLKFGPYPEKDALIYFTDNKNEPRKVNVYRAMLSGAPSTSVTDKLDFMSACPRVPLNRPTFEFKADLDRDINNFAGVQGFQFAYQAIYKDGLESAISPYSIMAFPPSVVDRGALNTDNILAHNMCEITIPMQGSEVEAVKILARYGNSSNFIEIQEVANESPESDIVFDFFNDRVASGVSPQTVAKTFDNVPQRAQAQTVTSNRLVYGNYVEGYDNVDCSGVDLEPVYIARPPELVDYTLQLEPSIELLDDDINKSMGFVYKVDQFAEEIAANTKITVSFSITPDNNFHVYSFGSAGDSYHQSRQVGSYSMNLPGYQVDGVVTGSAAHFQENDGYGEPGYQNDASAGGSYLHRKRDNYFGGTVGLGGGTPGTGEPFWKRKVALEDGTPAPANIRCVYGTSAGNPLILAGGKLTFRVSFTVNVAIASGGKELISKVFSMLMEGATQEQLNSQFDLGEGAITFDPEDVKRTHVHQIDLGLETRYAIPSEGDQGSFRNLICGWGSTPADLANLEDHLESRPPSGAFIVNKAEVGFFLQRSKSRSQGQHNAFVMGIGYVDVDENDGLMTCIRDKDPRSPWWVISRSDMDSIAGNPFVAYSESFQVTNRVFKSNFNWKQNFFTDNAESVKKGMFSSWGYMEVPESDGKRDLLPFTLDIHENRFGQSAQATLYSLMDGEGGPGGMGAGQGTAYDDLGCGRLGSIAGQCFVGVDDSHILHSKDRYYQAYMLNGQTGSFAQQPIVDSSIASDLDLELNESGVVLDNAVFMGPYYTGKIVLNNISISDPDSGDPTSLGSVNGRLLPYGENLTTTLPLVSFASWCSDSGEAESNVLLPVADGVYLGEQFTNGDASTQLDSGERQVCYPYPIVQPAEDGGGGIIDGELVPGTVDSGVFEGYSSVDFERLHSHGEFTFNVTSIEVEGSSGSLSFKSSATHEIGMVYYDERGRHGRVNPVGSVYVEGYGERGDKPKGKAMIKVSNITHDPPSWAKKYKFVYTKNTTVSDFIQYSSGGAFVTNSDYQGNNPTNIYVSLNYLQGHPISYSDAFGAKGKDGTPVMYSFTPGDRLRVISYMLSEQDGNINRVYPIGADFEVTGIVDIPEQDNPFVGNQNGGTVFEESMKGLFLVLKNNNDAFGFRYQSVQQGEDNWGSNCIFEIYSPLKELDSEDRLYYEIGDCYDVVYTANGYKHDFEQVILKEGDVFFRRHAVNLRDYDIEDGFVDMISVSDNEDESISPEPNFKNYYLESEAATDLFPSRSASIGRPNIVDLDARQAIKEASLVHSGRDVVAARKVGYSSFNRSIPSDMEIDIKPGPINYLSNHQDSLFFIQKNKCGQIPVDRSLLSDTQGTTSLIASSKFLNRPRYFSVDAGCDGNPESVVNIDNNMFFAHKSMGKVFKAGGNSGVQIISDKGMSSFIRNAFNDAMTATNGVRVLGGHDPLKKEYLLSITQNEFQSGGDVLPTPDYGWSASSEEIDESGVSVVYVAEVVLPEAFEEVLLDPQISIDWNAASQLAEPSWNLFYGENGGLNGDISYWQSDANNVNSQVALNTDAEIVIKFQDAQGFDSPQIIDLTIGSQAQGGGFQKGVMQSAAFQLNAINLVEGTLAYDTLNELGYYDDTDLVLNPPSGWSFNPAIIEQDGISDNGGPAYAITVTMDPAEHSGEVEYRIPIRFICSGDEPFQIMDEINIAPLENTTATFKGGIEITGAINESIAFNADVHFQDVADEYALGDITQADPEQGNIPLVFNPCHPVYGYWQENADENGPYIAPVGAFWLYLTSTFSLYLQHLQEQGVDTDARYQEIYDFVFNELESLADSGEPLVCPNINYPEDTVAPTEE